MSKSWASGSTRAWRRVRLLVLARDQSAGYACRAHEAGWCARSSAAPHTCSSTPTVVHHTTGRAVTGDDMRHLVSSCAPCNLAIGEPKAPPPDPPAVPVTRWR